jgi:hypothetical protein
MKRRIMLCVIILILFSSLTAFNMKPDYGKGEVNMTEVILIPHEGIEIKSIGKIHFGQTAEMVEEMLGAPNTSSVTFTKNMQYFYNDYDIKIEFNADKKVEFIECNAGPFSDKTKTLIYDIDFFNLPADEAIDLLEKRNDGSIFNENPGKPKMSLCFREIDVGIWRDMDETDIEESIKEAISSGVYETNKESYENEARIARYFKSIAIGKKGYYQG